MMRLCFVAALLLPFGVAAGPTVTATPANIDSVIAAASGGTTIMVSGTHGVVTIVGRKFAPPLVLRGGNFAGIVLRNVDGVTLSGSTITGTGQRNSYGVFVRTSANVRIEKAQIGGANRGIVLATVNDFAIVDSRFDGLGSDGIDIALSHRGVVSGNVMTNFRPRPPVYADGKLVKDGDHPDGIQLWSRPTDPPTSDITITGNSITGEVQCIFGGNHVRNGVDDGGFDRIVVENNTCRNTVGRGITLNSARASRIRFNDAASIPGSRLLKTGQAIRTQVLMRTDDPTSVICGNKVADVPKSPATASCR